MKMLFSVNIQIKISMSAFFDDFTVLFCIERYNLECPLKAYNGVEATE